MSRSRTFVLALLTLLLLTGASAGAGCGGDGGALAASISPSPDPVVLVVDGRPVRQSAIDAIRAEFRLSGTPSGEPRVEREAVRRELVRREAERLGVKADPAEVTARRAAMVDELGGEHALAAALEHLSMTDAQLVQGLEDSVLREALRDRKYSRLAATRAAAKSYYDRHPDLFRRPGSAHLGMIKVAAERIAKSALDRLRSGHPFAEVARQFSNDLEAKANGGDMGWLVTDSLPPGVRQAVVALKPGQVSEPVAGPGGWYIVKTVAARPARVVPFAAVEDRLRKEITRLRRSAALEAWLDAARDKASVTRP
jgi:parvulin-like peptidyl-prolyl isomerase